MTKLAYRDALNTALADAMREDDDVFVIGEEVGRYGGAYGVTKGLIDAFGPDRVIDTPISEPAIVGTAVGAAMAGMRPVAELMYVDFLGMTMDQLCNQAAKIRYMFGGQIGVPMVLRTQGGTGRSAGARTSHEPSKGTSLHTRDHHIRACASRKPATVAKTSYHLRAPAPGQPDPVGCSTEHKGL